MTGQIHFPVQTRDSYQIQLRHWNKLKICRTGKQSDLSDLIWAGITFPHLKPTTQSQISPIIPGRANTPECLNLTVAEGYPSRSQDSVGLKRDQFIKVPKSQSKWYKMHLLKLEGPHRPGRSVFNWRNTESKVNSVPQNH